MIATGGREGKMQENKWIPGIATNSIYDNSTLSFLLYNPTELGDDFRKAYSRLWRGLIMADEKIIKYVLQTDYLV